MTRLEFTELFENEINPLWPKWKPDQPLVDLYAEEFSRYESSDVLSAFRRHKVGQDYQDPKIPLVIKHLKAVVGERKAAERKQSTGNEWPGQVFVVVHHNQAGHVDFYRDFHIPSARAQVPKPFDSQRMDMHTESVKRTYSRQHPFGNWSGEIHTDETAHNRITEIREAWTADWVSKIYAKPKPVASKALKYVHLVGEVVQEVQPVTTEVDW
jgi:hypothetical protein